MNWGGRNSGYNIQNRIILMWLEFGGIALKAKPVGKKALPGGDTHHGKVSLSVGVFDHTPSSSTLSVVTLES